MPNYRNKNRNRNKNKQRYKQQQKQQQQNQKSEKSKKESEEASVASTSAPTNTTGCESQILPHPLDKDIATDASAVSSENKVTDVNASATEKSNELNVQSLTKIKDATTATTVTEPKTKTTVTTTETNDTVLNEPSRCDNKSENIHHANTDDIMGNEKSKIINKQRESDIKQTGEEVQHQANKQTAPNVPIIQPKTSAIGKVIVHRIVCEDSNNIKINNKEDTSINDLTKNENEFNKSFKNENEKSVDVVTQELLDNERETNQKQDKVMIHKIALDEDEDNQQQNKKQMSQQQVKVIINKVVTPDDDSETENNSNKQASEEEVKVVVHRVNTPTDESKMQEDNNQVGNEIGSNNYPSDQHEVKIIVHKLSSNCEEHEKFTQNTKMSTIPNDDSKALANVTQLPKQHQAKLIVHQVHVEDRDEEPKITSPTMREPIPTGAKPTTSEVRIVEISDESLSDLEELRSPVVSEAESSIEYSDEAQRVSDSIIEVLSSTSTTTTQKQSRKQKRIALEHHFLPQMLNPRFLDSISEENSELSDNSENPLSRSASTDSNTTNHPPTEGKVRKLNAKYPKSSLDFSKSHKQPSNHKKHSKIIREEPVAVAVAARLQDAPIADESCSTVRSCMSPEAQAAEIVFINSASSSMTDLHDMESFENIHNSGQEISLDSDIKDIVNKPAREDICLESLTASVSPPSTSSQPPPLTEFLTNQSNNNQIINNSKLINNNTSQTPHTTSTTPTAIKTILNTNSKLDSILLSSSSSSLSSPANDQLVFDQIEQQISSVLSSINEVASQNTNTNTTITSTPTSIATTSSPSSSSSSLSSLKIHTNLSNTQQLPVTTTSKTASTRIMETSCEKSFNANSSLCTVNNARTARVFSQDVNMNTVRDILINNNKNNTNGVTEKLNGNNENSATNGYVQLNYNNSNTFTPIPLSRGSPSPPAIPPPSHEHFIEQNHNEYNKSFTSAVPSFTSASASSFALPLLQNNVDYHNYQTQAQNEYPNSLNSNTDLHTSSDTRHRSLDSHCSDSTNLSQCTAINVANERSDKCDTVPTSSISDLKTKTTQHSHSSIENNSVSAADPKKLRLLCTETLASSPYGDAVLEELANVAQSIGETRAFKAVQFDKNMPYPLPELPHIDDLQLSLEVGKSVNNKAEPAEHDQSWLGVPTNSDPKVLVCLSPSQRSYIQQKPEHKPDDLLDAHQKFVDRRGYHEYTKEQLQLLEKEKLAEQQLLQTAAIMKKLRKSITPPPPQIPPPPVPVKSNETASKAQNLSKRTVTTGTLNQTQKQNNDVNTIHENKPKPTTSNGEHNGEENNKHRLLSIMQDTNESIANKQKHSVSTSSSYENNSRQTINGGVSEQAKEQVPSANSTFDSSTSRNSYQFINRQSSDHKAAGNMQSVETILGQMFPIMGSSNIFDQEHKRFSNIEASSTTEPFCSQILNAQPKRYSSIETHSYESQKRIENGNVLEDISTTKHETQTTGNKPDDLDNFPLATSLEQDNNSFLRSGIANNRNEQEIMSDFILNKHSSERERKQSEITIKNTTTETSQNNSDNKENQSVTTNEKDFIEKHKETEKNIPTRRVEDTYEEFRQRAKAAADAFSTLPTSNSKAATAATEKVTSNGDNKAGETISSCMSSEESTTTATTQHYKTTIPNYDHEKLFKEFDDLSKQLHRELETSKADRQQREKSASMFDLNRIHMTQKQQIEEFNRRRHEHFKELEQEIERSMRSRSLKFTRPQEPARDTVDHQAGRTYQIPIQIENGNSTPLTTTLTDKTNSTYEEAPPVPKPPKTYQIPIQIENNQSQSDDDVFRRAESMFNINDGRQHRGRRHSNQMPLQRAEDDWSKYANDFGSSENIVRPFAKEVEICYQRRPGGIRAPRLSVSTNDLSFNNHQHSYDQFNAYNVRRHHAPMLNGAPEQNRPKFGSCYSMIERDPNPKYISTTTRRGVSPAPQPSGYFNLEGCHVKEEDMRQRRASLPRELHEQQLKYIASKEEALRTEFERLQSERFRLMKEAQKTQMLQTDQTQSLPLSPTRPLRDHYRSNQKLPTLTEDEVFRQQMAEEWLNKVAEREKRRLQNIIKISKIHEDEATSKHKADMGEEFLSRVKERRHKLAMPADSDWESGAESQPTVQAQLSEAEDVPPVKIIEGEKEANLRRLPPHLREFAKFSNHQSEKIEGGHREEHQEEERSEETTDNSVSRAYKKSSMVKTVKTLRTPLSSDNHGHGRNQYNTLNGYQSEPEPNSNSDYSTIKYRAVNPNRLQSVSSALNVRKSNDTLYGTLPHPVKSGQNSYKNQPGRIEDYVTGHSSVSEKEKKEWWDEIMDIFNVQFDQSKLSSHYTEGNLSRALAKESGYTSDSNLVFRKKELPQSSPLSPVEQKQAYKNVQAGGEPPLFGFRKPAPEKSKVSPNRYYESDVNIHFKTPVRQEFKYPLSEEELAIRQAEQMQKLYQEERRRKYLQELQDMNARRHTDNFTPSQKSPIPLNRYDDFPADLAPKTSNHVKSVARALYNFQAQNSKELSFKKGDIIYVKRAIDKNWYEGEHNAMIGLFPANYVEIINKETVYPIQPQASAYRKPSEGQARAKYNFQAQSGVELSLNKGELVALTRRVDDNWFEGRIANRKGIFPVSYVEVLTDIGAEDIAARTTTIQQTSLANSRPSLDALRTNINNEFNTLTRNGNQPPNAILRETRNAHKTDILHVDTSSEPLVYRALYKYRPQNSDELELQEGDIVHVLEKCDDGWYVGTSQRTGCFGTFPGNYVERV